MMQNEKVFCSIARIINGALSDPQHCASGHSLLLLLHGSSLDLQALGDSEAKKE